MMLDGEEEENKDDKKSPLKDYAEGAIKSFADTMEDIANRANDVDKTMAQINETTISLNSNLGGSEVYLQTIGKNITDAAAAILQVSKDITTFEQAQALAGKLIADIQDETGRGYIATGKELQNIIIAQEASGVEGSKLVANFKDMGYSLQSIPKEMQKVIDTSKALGVNVHAVAEEVTSNLKQMNLFNFSNGVEGLTRMAAQAGMFGIKMENIFRISESLLNPEAAIDMAASLQRLGVATSDLLDPLKLMDLGQNNPQELQNQIADMAKQFTYFNEENQKFEILPGAKRQLREVADALKMDVGELANMAIGSSDLAKKMNEIRFPDLGIEIPEDQKTMIANMAEMKDGQYKIQVEETAIDEEGRRYGTGIVNEKSISELSSDDLESLQYQQKQNNKSLEDIGREGLTYQARIATAAEATAGKLRGGTATSAVANQGVVQMNKSLKEFSNLFTGSFENEDVREGYQELIQMSTSYFSKLDKLSEGGLDEKEKEEMKKMADELDKFSKSSLGKTTDFFSKFLENIGKMPGDFISSVSKTLGETKKIVDGKETKSVREEDVLNKKDTNLMDNILALTNKNKEQVQQPVTSNNQNTNSQTDDYQKRIHDATDAIINFGKEPRNGDITNNTSNTNYDQTFIDQTKTATAQMTNNSNPFDLSPMVNLQGEQLNTSKGSLTELQTLNSNIVKGDESLISAMLKMTEQKENVVEPKKDISTTNNTQNTNNNINTTNNSATNTNYDQTFVDQTKNVTTQMANNNGLFDLSPMVNLQGEQLSAIKGSLAELQTLNSNILKSNESLISAMSKFSEQKENVVVPTKEISTTIVQNTEPKQNTVTPEINIDPLADLQKDQISLSKNNFDLMSDFFSNKDQVDNSKFIKSIEEFSSKIGNNGDLTSIEEILPTQKEILNSNNLTVDSINKMNENLISYVSKLEDKDIKNVDVKIPEQTGLEVQQPTIGREEQKVQTSEMITNNITNNNLAQQIANPISNTQNNSTSFDGKLTIDVNITAPPGVDTAAIKEVVTQTMHDTKVRANIIQSAINPRVGSYNPTTGIPV